MKKCYCKETQTEYESITQCAQMLQLDQSDYGRIVRQLRQGHIIEVNGYTIGCDSTVLNYETQEWRQPYPDIDLEVNKLGQIRKKSTKAIKQTTHNANGYLYITLTTAEGKKVYTAHRLIAKAFLPNYQENLVVDHINGVRDDNRLENLCMKTQQENLQARDENNKPLYEELRRLILQYGYEKTYALLKQL